VLRKDQGAYLSRCRRFIVKYFSLNNFNRHRQSPRVSPVCGGFLHEEIRKRALGQMSSDPVDFLDAFDVKQSHDVLVQVVCTGAAAAGTETRAKRRRRGDAAADRGAAADQRRPKRVLREIYGHQVILQKSSAWMRARLSPDWNQVGACWVYSLQLFRSLAEGGAVQAPTYTQCNRTTHPSNTPSCRPILAGLSWQWMMRVRWRLRCCCSSACTALQMQASHWQGHRRTRFCRWVYSTAKAVG